MTLTDLPTDVIVLIFPYLSASEFLSFTSCTKRLLSFRHEPTFWRLLTTRTFRVPSQPLLRSDGARWQWLYKSLLTQTHVYTWGNNERGNLGYSSRRRAAVYPHQHSYGLPNKYMDLGHVGVVADVQCGGWSTVLLNSLGEVFFCGVLDGEQYQLDSHGLAPLTFPPAYPPTTRYRYEPDTAIKQYSVGRSRVMGLSDSGKIWEWAKGTTAGMLVKLISVDVAEGAKFGKGRVTRVVSGWAGSSAYINGTGIVYWVRMPEQDEATLMDAYLLESFTVPGTSFKRIQADQYSQSSLESRIGEVINHIVLEHSIVFITHLNKVFAYPFSFDLKPGSTPVELTTFQQASSSFHIEDIQGSFRNFGIFSRDGAVLLGNTTLINSFNDSPRDPLPQPFIPPALQSASVISLAFGDYHYHALHADGTITSHGSEPLSCGAFGLGLKGISTIRGVHDTHRDGSILPSSPQSDPSRPPNTSTLRTVWFEPEKNEWLHSLHQTCCTTASEAVSETYWRNNWMNEEAPEVLRAYGDWFEREGRAWHLGPPEQRIRAADPAANGASDNHPDQGAFFAVKISAAGWHSAALVLVDREKAERVKRKYQIPISHSPSLSPRSTNDPSKEDGNKANSPANSAPAGSPSSRPRITLNLGGLGAYLQENGRLFLGLGARDEIQSRSREDDVNADAPEEQPRTRKYIWEGSPLPRLEQPDGSVLPGTGEVAGWRVVGHGRDV